MSEIDPQEFGKLQAQVAVLIKANDEKMELLRELQTGISALREILAEARGGVEAPRRDRDLRGDHSGPASTGSLDKVKHFLAG